MTADQPFPGKGDLQRELGGDAKKQVRASGRADIRSLCVTIALQSRRAAFTPIPRDQLATGISGAVGAALPIASVRREIWWTHQGSNLGPAD